MSVNRRNRTTDQGDMTITSWILLMVAVCAAGGACAWQCYQRITAGRSMVRVLAVWAVVITGIGFIFLPLGFPQKAILYVLVYAVGTGCVLLDLWRERSKRRNA
jgi:hypothetical protein